MDPVRRAIVERARDTEALRNRITRDHPHLTPDQVEDRVTLRLQQVAGGRKGAARSRAKAAATQRILDNLNVLRHEAQTLLNLINTLADPHTGCDHIWPAELDTDAYCLNCGLPYDDWTDTTPSNTVHTEAAA
jgi:hypothetical protein